jgi:thiol-disulfide isomerase/thioredoxin
MKQLIVLVAFVLMVLACKNSKEKSHDDTLTTVTSVENVNDKASSEALEIYDFEGFKKFLNRKDDKTYVINFWATWCAPCVKELPYFEKLTQNYSAKGVEVILVSLDFPHMFDTKLKPFIKKRDLKSKVIVLNDPSENKWITAVDSSWSGSIPATVIYSKKGRRFYEQSFTYDALEKEVKLLK